MSQRAQVFSLQTGPVARLLRYTLAGCSPFLPLPCLFLHTHFTV